MTVVETFAAWGADPGSRLDSPEVVHHAKRAVIDWYAAVMPGAVEAPAKLLEVAMIEDLDRGAARLVLGRRSSVRAAALINGTAAHTVEVDDIYKHAIYHPGAPVIAAALAVAHAVNASGMELLRAVTIGYEISTRIGAAMGRAHYRYWHNTGTVGTLGAAAAAAALYRLDARAFANALATATTFAAGLQQAFRTESMSKPLHAGRAAESGLLAAQLARAGVTGSMGVIDGDFGLGRAMSDAPNWHKAVETLGAEFHITAMTFKNHACCGHTFAAIDGALALQRQMDVAAHDIARIKVATYRPALDVAGNMTPASAAEARFSLSYVVATALLHGSVRLAAFTPERLADPEIRALMARIELSVDPEFDCSFPGQRGARVRIEKANGEVGIFLQPNRKGDPEEPLSDDELHQKFKELVSPVIGKDASHALLDRLCKLDLEPRVS